jgi:hypothetical protein
MLFLLKNGLFELPAHDARPFFVVPMSWDIAPKPPSHFQDPRLPAEPCASQAEL